MPEMRLICRPSGGFFPYVRACIFFINTGHKNNHTVRCGYFYGILRYFKCSGQVNCPCAKVLPAAKRLYGAKAPPRCAGPRF